MASPLRSPECSAGSAVLAKLAIELRYGRTWYCVVLVAYGLHRSGISTWDTEDTKSIWQMRSRFQALVAWQCRQATMRLGERPVRKWPRP
jgi:hypothetical protein